MTDIVPVGEDGAWASPRGALEAGTHDFRVRARRGGAAADWVETSITVPAGVVRDATLDVDFTAPQAYTEPAGLKRGGVISAPSAVAAVARATPAFACGGDGLPVRASANVLRDDHDPVTLARRGIRREPATGYADVNSLFAGASAGNWPTGWAETPNSADVVCDVQSVEDHGDYKDLLVTFFGTSTSSTGRAIYAAAAGAIATAVGDVWSIVASIHIDPDGTHTDTTMAAFASFRLDLATYTSTPAKILDNTKTIAITTTPTEHWMRFRVPATALTPVSVRPGFQFFIPSGNTVKLRLRIRVFRVAKTMWKPSHFDIATAEVLTPASINDTFAGATGTTPPTGWTYAVGNGVTWTWEAVEDLGDRVRARVRIAGTSSSASPKQMRMMGTTGIAAVAGDKWRGLARMRLVPESEAGVPSSMTGFTSFSIALVGADSGGTAVDNDSLGTNIATALNSVMAEYSTDNTLAGGTVANIYSLFRSVVANGTTVGATLEIELPKLAKVTSQAISTRAADAIAVTDGAWRIDGPGTVLAEFEPEDLGSTSTAYLPINLDLGGGNGVVVRRKLNGFYEAEITAGGVSQGVLALGSRQTSDVVRLAIAYDADGFVAGKSDSLAVEHASAITLPTGSAVFRLCDGGFVGWLRRVAYLPRKMTAAEIDAWCGGDVVTEGVISDRCRGANGRIGGGSYTRAESRILVDFPAGASSATILLPTYYIGASQGSETYNDLSSYTARAYIELDGAAVLVGGPFEVTPGLLEARMPLTLPDTLAAGAYYLRIGAEFAAGGYVPGVYDVGDSGEGFYLSTAAAASQLNGTGAMFTPSGGATTTAGFGPVGIVGLDETGGIPDSAANISDSIGFGQTATATGKPLGWFPQGANSAGIPSMNLGRGGTRALETDPAVAPIRMGLVKYGTITTVALGTNDLQLLDETVPQIIDHIINIGLAVRRSGSKPILVPVMPRCGASTDGWASAAGQTPNPGFEAGGDRRDPVNAFLSSMVGIVFAAKLDLNAIAADAAHADKWRSNGVANTGGDADFSTNDGIHPHKALHTALAAEFEAQIPALLAA